MVPTTHSYTLVWQLAFLLCSKVTYLFTYRRSQALARYGYLTFSKKSLNTKSQPKVQVGVWRYWGADGTGEEEEWVHDSGADVCQGCLTEISHLALCYKTLLNPTINLGQFWFPGSAQLTAVQRCTWKKNPAEHNECRQSPGNSTRKCCHVQITNFQRENWLNFGNFRIKLKHYISARGHPLTNFKYMFQFRGALQYFKEDIAIKKWHRQLF